MVLAMELRGERKATAQKVAKSERKPAALYALAVVNAASIETTDDCKVTATMWDTPTDLSCYNELSCLDPSTPDKLKHVFHEHPRDLQVRPSLPPTHSWWCQGVG
jgi:hypothetical protein